MISKFKPFLGPSNYVFKDPDTGLAYKEKTKKTLIDRIRSYRKQNELPDIEFLDEVLESYWCSLPENVGRCEPKVIERGIVGYFKGGIALLKNMVFSSYVPKEEAERRAEICSTCPHNVKTNIAWADLVAYHSIGDRSTSYDSKLGTCALCSCPLRAKVHLGGDLGITPDIKKTLPNFCWQK